MIRASELRIGNKVQYTVNGDQKHIGEITGINKTEDGLKAVIDYHYPLSFGEPIELTPEILEKCGFVYDNNDDWYVFESEKGISISHIIGGLTHYFGILEQLWADVLQEIKYLHQLQNLVHALTGEELTVNL